MSSGPRFSARLVSGQVLLALMFPCHILRARHRRLQVSHQLLGKVVAEAQCMDKRPTAYVREGEEWVRVRVAVMSTLARPRRGYTLLGGIPLFPSNTVDVTIGVSPLEEKA